MDKRRCPRCGRFRKMLDGIPLAHDHRRATTAEIDRILKDTFQDMVGRYFCETYGAAFSRDRP